MLPFVRGGSPCAPRALFLFRGGWLVAGVLVWLTFGPALSLAATWTDALGRSVVLPNVPRRIVSLVPSVTETLFALGVGDRVVGVTDFSDFPEPARALPRVGSYAEPSVEGVVALEPDLVFAAGDMTRQATVNRLTEAGVPVYVVYPRNLASTAQMLRQVGEVVGASEAGERLAAELEGAVRRVASSATGRPHPRVLLCVMVQPLVVAGPGTLPDDLITVAGGRNAVPPGPSRYPTWGPEALLAVDPDVILVSPHPGQPDPITVFRQWPELRAVAAGRVISVEADWVHRPGPRLVLGLEAVARAIRSVGGGAP